MPRKKKKIEKPKNKKTRSDKFTVKMELFCQKYIELDNASEAYRQIYDCGESKANTIYCESYRLMKNPRITHRISELQKEHLARHEVTIDKVIKEYKKLAFFDIRKLFNDLNSLKSFHELTDEEAACIAAFDEEDIFEWTDGQKEKIGRLKKIKLVDKKAALDSLAKFLGMFIEKKELSTKDGKPIPIQIIDDLKAD